MERSAVAVLAAQRADLLPEETHDGLAWQRVLAVLTLPDDLRAGSGESDEARERGQGDGHSTERDMSKSNATRISGILGWSSNGRPADIHVLPVNDTIEHQELRQCWCRPDVKENAGATMVTHHAADGREYFEERDDAAD